MTEFEKNRIMQHGPLIYQKQSQQHHGHAGITFSVCKRLIELMKGEMELHSLSGQGMDIAFTIEGEKLTKEEKQNLFNSLKTIEQPMDIPERPKQILIVEDNQVNQKVLSSILSKNGHTCSIAQNGQEGFQKAMEQEYDLVFMDVEMPVMNGYDATRAIRQMETERGSKPIPIVCLTGNARIEYKKLAFDSGMTDYITKPFKREEILRLVSRLTIF
eukprot:TRINITY_DN11851_c0_g1_i1.p1 TRINITY_DN11851_c0_g1~~TRINITY_DN11851_c0_g1_i1.p1  ORF type:complete len:216 (-),score=57.95 TRINITY_DN11851_c0_g1_i1:12-659(-)